MVSIISEVISKEFRDCARVCARANVRNLEIVCVRVCVCARVGARACVWVGVPRAKATDKESVVSIIADVNKEFREIVCVRACVCVCARVYVCG